MSRYTPAARPLVQCLRTAGRRPGGDPAAVAGLRAAACAPACAPAFATSARQWQAAAASPSPPPPPPPPPPSQADPDWALDPARTTLPWAEKELMRRGTPPVGSRRRRAALQTTAAIARALAGDERAGDDHGPIPFELLPYQCFQEARQVLKADRDAKLQAIAAEAAKIRKLEAVLAQTGAGGGGGGGDAAAITSRGGAAFVQKRLASLRKHVEHLKILADINDPLVKRRFEDGLGDMNKPIYRYLAEQRWRGRPRRLIEQRIRQFYLAPDLLPPAQLRPTADVELFFRSYKVAPGAVVDSLISELCPRLRVQVFDRGARLVTVLVVDADVPVLADEPAAGADAGADAAVAPEIAPEAAPPAYTNRCHFLAANVPLAPTQPSLALSRLDPAAQVVLPWLPAFALKGSPPHRLAVLVLEQPASKDADTPGAGRLDVAALQTALAANANAADAANAVAGREHFSVRDFVRKHGLRVAACTLFRTAWDAGTDGVMERAGIPGTHLELKPLRPRSLKPPRKARGWEAKHQGPKYRHLWKYTHRIATPKRKFVR